MNIGEFAQLAGISTKMLRHYDAIGLFSPASIDETNGYRHYAISQSDQLKWILLLKQLGFSLAQIKLMTGGPIEKSQLVEALKEQRLVSAITLREALGKHMQIEALLSLVDQEDFTMNKTIDLNHYNPEAILAVKNSMPTVDHLIERAQVLIQNHGHIHPERINALFRIDMRGFARINDTCGYQVGDRLLVALFQALQGVCTTLDASHALARAGGDEFLVFIQAEEKHIGQFSTLLLESLKTVDYRALGSEYPLEIYISGIENALYFNNDIFKLLEITSVGLPKAKALMVDGKAPIHIVSQGE